MSNKSRIPYNDGLPKNISGMSNKEKLKEAHSFAEGCVELEECLNCLWENGLNTFSCCKGYHEIKDEDIYEFDSYAISTCMSIPYIAFDTTDVLKYLSFDFIDNDNIQIEVVESNEYHVKSHVVLRFYGVEAYKLITKLKEDVRSGIKQSEETISLLNEKINKEVSPEILYKSMMLGYERSNITIGKESFAGYSSVNDWWKCSIILKVIYRCSTSENLDDIINRLFEISNIGEESKIRFYESKQFKECLEWFDEIRANKL